MQGDVTRANSLKGIKVDMNGSKKKQFSGEITGANELLMVLEHLLNAMLNKSLKILQKNSSIHEKYFDVWNSSQTILQKLGKIYAIVQMANRWHQNLGDLEKKCMNTFSIVEDLFKVHIIDKLLAFKVEMIADGFLDVNQIEELEVYYETLCGRLGESSVRIIDAIGNEDFMVGSCIGCKDGDAYNRLATVVEAQKDCYEIPSWLDKLREVTNRPS